MCLKMWVRRLRRRILRVRKRRQARIERRRLIAAVSDCVWMCRYGGGGVCDPSSLSY